MVKSFDDIEPYNVIFMCVIDSKLYGKNFIDWGFEKTSETICGILN